MNVLTFCSIEYTSRSFFSKTRYMIGVGLKKLGRTPVPKLPSSYHPELDPIADCETSNKFVIFSDSLSVLTSLDHTPSKIPKFKNYLKNIMTKQNVMK